MLNAALLLAASASSGAHVEVAPLTVLLNGEDLGVMMLPLQEGKTLCLPVTEWKNLGVPERLLPVPTEDGAPCIDVKSLAPHVQVELDSINARLQLRVDPTLLALRQVSFRPPEDSLPIQFGRSAYLNYGINLRRQDDIGGVGWTAPLELSVREGRWVLHSSWLASEDRVEHLSGALRLDVPERLAALRFGDVSASGGRVTAGSALLGAQWSRNFAYEPLRRRTPGLGFTGVLDTPSTLEIFLDGRRISRTELPSGPYRLDDIPGAVGGSGELRVEITDAFGNRQVIEQPYYLGSGLLSAGESDFSYAIGLPHAAGRNRYADQPAAQAAHRWGLSDALTLGFETLATADQYVTGVQLDTHLGPYGELGAGAYIGGAHESGRAFSFASYRYSAGAFSANLEYAHREAGFYAPQLAASGGTANNSERRAAARVSARLPGNASLNFSYAQVQTNGAADDQRIGLGFSTRVARRLTISMQAQHRLQGGTTLLLSLSGTPRPSAFAQFSASETAQSQQYSTRYSHSAAGTLGYGYRLDFDETRTDAGDPQQGYGAELDERAQHYSARLGHNESENSSTTRLNLSGSIALAGGGLALGQPIRGSYATVHLPELPGVEVMADGRRVGRTGALPVMISDLSPYRSHLVRLRLPESMPVGVELAETTHRLKLADRGGQALRFGVRRLRLYEGSLRREDGSAVEYAALRVISASGVSIETVTGQGGLLYLDSLDAGTYLLEVAGAKPCRAEVELPAADEISVQIGDVTCTAAS